MNRLANYEIASELSINTVDNLISLYVVQPPSHRSKQFVFFFAHVAIHCSTQTGIRKNVEILVGLYLSACILIPTLAVL